jgi:hypothetical protein
MSGGPPDHRVDREVSPRLRGRSLSSGAGASVTPEARFLRPGDATVRAMSSPWPDGLSSADVGQVRSEERVMTPTTEGTPRSF